MWPFNSTNTHGISPAFYDLLKVAGVLIVLSVIIVIVVVLIRRKRRRKRHSKPAILQNSEEYKRSREAEEKDADEDEVEAHARHGERRRRRKKRPHRPLNPTLAETRGLPPKRDDGSPPKTGL